MCWKVIVMMVVVRFCCSIVFQVNWIQWRKASCHATFIHLTWLGAQQISTSFVLYQRLPIPKFKKVVFFISTFKIEFFFKFKFLRYVSSEDAELANKCFLLNAFSSLDHVVVSRLGLNEPHQHVSCELFLIFTKRIHEHSSTTIKRIERYT